MRRVNILGRNLDPSELQKLKALLEQAGCVPNEVFVTDTAGPPDLHCDDEVFVVLLTEPVLAAIETQQEVAAVPNGGRRAICVWPEGAAPTPLPEAITNFSYSIVWWNADRLSSALANDDVICLDQPDGQPMPKPDPDHLECDE
ncbi:MAG: hypothetical protein NVV62_10630 [Terricaulis sp.]|nr:hypothetical protein [Terricaulis sp.]